MIQKNLKTGLWSAKKSGEKSGEKNSTEFPVRHMKLKFGPF